MADEAIARVLIVTIQHAIGSPLEALIRVLFEGGLVYSLCILGRIAAKLRWSPRQLQNICIVRAVRAYGWATTFLNCWILLPVSSIQVIWAVLRGLYMLPASNPIGESNGTPTS